MSWIDIFHAKRSRRTRQPKPEPEISPIIIPLDESGNFSGVFAEVVDQQWHDAVVQLLHNSQQFHNQMMSAAFNAGFGSQQNPQPAMNAVFSALQEIAQRPDAKNFEASTIKSEVEAAIFRDSTFTNTLTERRPADWRER